MSGGQQQRVALARALVNRPTVLLLDEPLGALDLKLRKEMQLELKALQREVGITFVYVTHDQEEALTMSDVIVVMRDGLIQQMGGPTELYERPVNRFVAGLHRHVELHRRARSSSSTHATGARRRRADRGLRSRARHRPGGRPPPATGRDGRDPTRAARVEPAEAGDGEAAGWTSVPGRINQGTYLGDQTEYRVTHRSGGRAHRPPPERHRGAGGGPGSRARAIRSSSAGARRRTSSSSG